jgi:hypothetical protein
MESKRTTRSDGGERYMQDSVPWARIAGFSTAVLSLLFFMGVVLISMFGHPVPCDARFIVVVIFAMSTGMAASFIGGSAAAEGHIPIGGSQAHPLAFGVSGGIAVLVIVLGLGSAFYVSDDCIESPRTGFLPLVQVTGRVLESSGTPLGNAKIRASGYTESWTTLADGTFACSFTDVRQGAPLHLSITATMHAPWVSTVRPTSGSFSLGDVMLLKMETGSSPIRATTRQP